MAVLKKIALLLVLAVILFFSIGLFLPKTVHVERATVIDAPRATVFTLVNTFRTFNKWSPWFSRDAQAAYVFEGPDSGVGAKMSWKSDKPDVGSGSQQIFESRPFESVKTNLDFGAQGVAVATFALGAEGTATRVVWGLDTDLGMNPLSRWFGLMFDRMIGPDYEKGLAGLKKLAESLPKADFSDLEVAMLTAEPATVAFVATASAKDDAAIAQAIGTAYMLVGKFMAANGLKQAAAPITINTAWEAERYVFDAAIPVDREPEKAVRADSLVRIKKTWAGRAVRAVHRGPYKGLSTTYDKVFAYVAANGLEAAGPSWDQYVSDPGNTPEAALITHVYVPVK